MPLVHFGDTSFEKYFFGGQGKSASRPNQVLENGVGNEKKSGSSVSNSNIDNGSAKTNEIDRWQAPPVDQLVRSDHNGIESNSNMIKSTDFPAASRSDHSKSRGAHTTTVKILNDESNALRRLAQGVVGSRSLGQIQLQFSAASRSLSPLHFDDDADDHLDNADRKSDDGSEGSNESRCSVSHTTKISLQLMPATIAHQLPCIAEPLASLKSVRLVMSIERMSAAGLRSVMLSSLCGGEHKSLIPWSQQLGLDAEVKSLTDAKDNGDDERKEEDAETDRSTTKSSSTIPMLMDKPHNEDNKNPSAQTMTRTATKLPESTKNEATSNTPATKPIEAASTDTGIKQAIPVKRSTLTPTDKIDTTQNVKRTESIDVTDQPAVAKPELTTPPKTKIISSLNNDDEEEGIPTYENIFDAVSVYENCNLAKARRSKEARSNKDTAPTPARRRRPASTSKQQVVTSNGGSVEESKRSVSRSSGGSRDGSIGKANIKPVAASRHQQPTAASRRKLVVVKANGSESGQSAVVSNADKSCSSEVTRAKKKPVEVVYETAVYNMKNEKLSKPNKGREMKGPRLINEFICGSKVKRASDKKTTKTANVTQNTGKRKDIPLAVSR